MRKTVGKYKIATGERERANVIDMELQWEEERQHE